MYLVFSAFTSRPISLLASNKVLSAYNHNKVKCISGGPVKVEEAVKEAIVVHKSLVTLTPTNHLKLIKVHTGAHKVNPTKLKG
jgi:hypothetical protein